MAEPCCNDWEKAVRIAEYLSGDNCRLVQKLFRWGQTTASCTNFPTPCGLGA